MTIPSPLFAVTSLAVAPTSTAVPSGDGPDKAPSSSAHSLRPSDTEIEKPAGQPPRKAHSSRPP
ncbi:hypothetical protein [Streptomyces alfalfae]